MRRREVAGVSDIVNPDTAGDDDTWTRWERMSDHRSHPTAALILPTLTSSLHHLEKEDQLSLAQKTQMDHNSMVQEAGDMSEEQSGHVLGQSGHVAGSVSSERGASGHDRGSVGRGSKRGRGRGQ